MIEFVKTHKRIFMLLFIFLLVISASYSTTIGQGLEYLESQGMVGVGLVMIIVGASFFFTGKPLSGVVIFIIGVLLAITPEQYTDLIETYQRNGGLLWYENSIWA